VTMTQNQYALTFVTESLPAFEVGEEYAEWLQVSGGTPPYSFEVAQGNLPPGIEVTPMGTVNGVPSAAGDTTFWVKVTDSSGATLTQAFDAQVSPQPDPNGGNQ
jgi:Putative Ig domain